MEINIAQKNGLLLLLLVCLCGACTDRNASADQEETTRTRPPNILFAISDDQSYPYASAYGDRATLTPAFDAIAERGILFTQAFVAAPQCSPSRAALLTGRNIWQLAEAGTHSSYFPKRFPVFTDALEENGYALGFTGKPWGPGNWWDAGWERNPVGPEFNAIRYDAAPQPGISDKNYAANFEAFLQQKTADQPFFFWYGGHEPHRVFDDGIGTSQGKELAQAQVPNFLPDTEVIRSDLLDYSAEIEWFDQHLGDMLAHLDSIGELEHTIVVVTADNGMAFPYAKANLVEYGTHVPLAIAGPGIQGSRTVDDLVSLIDLAPTFLDLTQTNHFEGITGQSLAGLLLAKDGPADYQPRTSVLTGRERHTHARPDNLGYPARAIRTDQYLYIQNLKPDRWPAGDPAVVFPKNHSTPEGFKSMEEGYHDIDPAPSKTLLLDPSNGWHNYLELAVAKRPAEELYDIQTDPACNKNLAGTEALAAVQEQLKNELIQALTEQGDPRMLGTGDVFESYPRFGGMREFPGFRERGVYNEAYRE